MGSLTTTPDAASLRSTCSLAIIVAHREDTTALRGALMAHGFEVLEVRGPYSEAQAGWSASAKCLANHRNAWAIAADRSTPSLVLEADFVPVRGFGDLPVPVPDGNTARPSLPYLYACGPQVWDVDGGVGRGHAGANVALVIWPSVAKLLLEFCDELYKENPSGAYISWDTRLGYWLLERGIQSYFPLHQYGEHGGIINPEHKAVNLGRPHRADSLAASLEFLPAYAAGSRARYLVVRLRAKLWGVLRLLTGRLAARHDLARPGGVRLLTFALRRLL